MYLSFYKRKKIFRKSRFMLIFTSTLDDVIFYGQLPRPSHSIENEIIDQYKAS